MSLSFLPIGIYMQPAANFARVKGYGCTHVITDKSKPDAPTETPVSRDAYLKKADDNGLKVIIGPAPNPALDIGKPGFCAWCLRDEPDKGSPPDWNAVADAYVQKCADLKTIGPHVSLFGNFSGGRVLSARASGGNITEPLQSHYAKFAGKLDAWGGDKYVRARGEPAERIADYGALQDKLKLIAPDKPTFAVVETCDQGLHINPPKIPANPTPDEVKAMVWLALIHGAQGIFYFTLVPSGGTKPFSWDATPPDVAAALPDINSEVRALEEFILFGTRTRGAGEDATWTLPNNGSLNAVVTLAGGKWSTKINAYQPVVVDPEKELMRARLAKIDAWAKAFPLS